MQLSDKIRMLRKKNDMSQEQLADHLGVSRQTISKWELGDSVPDTINIIQLSKIFHVTTDHLLLETEEPSPSVPTKTFPLSKKAEQLFVKHGYLAGIYLMVKDLVGVIGGMFFAAVWFSVLSSIGAPLSSFPVQSFLLPIASSILAALSLINLIIHFIITLKLKKLDQK